MQPAHSLGRRASAPSARPAAAPLSVFPATAVSVPRAPCVAAAEVPAGPHQTFAGPTCHMQPARASTIAAAGKGFGAPVKKAKSAAVPATDPCPCQSGKTYGDCCSPHHEGKSYPATPEALLRARYCAYYIKNAEFIGGTTHPESREYRGSKNSYLQGVRATQRRADWHGLQIIKQEPGKDADEAFIIFRASFSDKENKEDGVQARTERSQFSRDAQTKGRWMYMGSEIEK